MLLYGNKIRYKTHAQNSMYYLYFLSFLLLLLVTFECLFVQLHYTRSFNFTNQSIIKYILFKESVIALFFTIDSCLKLADVYYAHIIKGEKNYQNKFISKIISVCLGRYKKMPPIHSENCCVLFTRYQKSLCQCQWRYVPDCDLFQLQAIMMPRQ